MSTSEPLYWVCSSLPANLPTRRARLWRLSFALADSHQLGHVSGGHMRRNQLAGELAPTWFVMFLARETIRGMDETLELALD